MDAYDESWYMDTAECSAYYPVEEIYSYLEEYMDLVEALQKEANGGISLAEAQKRIFVESRHHLFYLAQLIRLAMQRAIWREAAGGEEVCFLAVAAIRFFERRIWSRSGFSIPIFQEQYSRELILPGQS